MKPRIQKVLFQKRLRELLAAGAINEHAYAELTEGFTKTSKPKIDLPIVSVGDSPVSVLIKDSYGKQGVYKTGMLTFYNGLEVVVIQADNTPYKATDMTAVKQRGLRMV